MSESAQNSRLYQTNGVHQGVPGNLCSGLPGRNLLVYIDESHFHRNMDLGYTWAEKGKPAWRLSDYPPLSDRIDWYGAYDFSNGQCFIWDDHGCSDENTVKFLSHLVEWLSPATCPTVIVWDGAPCHKARLIQDAAAALGLLFLP